MEEQYQTILLHYITDGGEPDLELAYECGRQAVVEGTSVLQVIDAHYQALSDVLSRAETPEDSMTIVQRASSLLKEALSPFEMTQRGYGETINVLRNQNEKLTKLMEEKSELLTQREDFMMVVTHDLKTPINAADRCLALLLEGDFGALTDTQLEVLSTMKESNQRMFTMVRNLLDAYRYEQSTPVLHMFKMDVSQTATAVVNNFKLPAQMRDMTIKAELDTEQPNMVLGDANAIQHLITNLIDNAIKFTPDGGVITLKVRRHEDSIKIEVSDTGRGIGKDEQSRLFQRFFQAEGGKKMYTGTGLGLYLCNQIAAAHHGTIECESEVGHGTTFIVTLPSIRD